MCDVCVPWGQDSLPAVPVDDGLLETSLLETGIWIHENLSRTRAERRDEAPPAEGSGPANVWFVEPSLSIDMGYGGVSVLSMDNILEYWSPPNHASVRGSVANCVGCWSAVAPSRSQKRIRSPHRTK